MTTGPFGFPAEHLLADLPPNYPTERLMLTLKLGVVFLFFFILPFLLARPIPVEASPQETKNKASTVNQTRGKGGAKKSKGQKNENATSGNCVPPKEEEKVLEIHFMANLLALVGAVVTMTYLIVMTSPDNYYTTNGVFQAPLLTRDECQYILQMADEAAASNFATASEIQSTMVLAGGEANETIQHLLKEPRGWNKLRHKEYPTTDLNLVTDPFTKEHREWLRKKMDARLAPILQRIWGIPPKSIRANDVRKSGIYVGEETGKSILLNFVRCFVSSTDVCGPI